MPADVGQLLAAWESDANWMKKQPGYISAQLHRGIAGSCIFLNYAVWGIGRTFPPCLYKPRISECVGGLSVNRERIAALV
jgi:hypothetical protein